MASAASSEPMVLEDRGQTWIEKASPQMTLQQAYFKSIKANGDKWKANADTAFSNRSKMHGQNPAMAATNLSDALRPCLTSRACLYKSYLAIQAASKTDYKEVESVYKRLMDEMTNSQTSPLSEIVHIPQQGQERELYVEVTAWGIPSNPIFTFHTYLTGGNSWSIRSRAYTDLDKEKHSSIGCNTKYDYFKYIVSKGLFDAVTEYFNDPYQKLESVTEADIDVSKTQKKLDSIPRPGPYAAPPGYQPAFQPGFSQPGYVPPGFQPAFQPGFQPAFQPGYDSRYNPNFKPKVSGPSQGQGNHQGNHQGNQQVNQQGSNNASSSDSNAAASDSERKYQMKIENAKAMIQAVLLKSDDPTFDRASLVSEFKALQRMLDQ